MKDKSVGQNNPKTEDFDLDSFLKENNFLTQDDDKKSAQTTQAYAKSSSAKKAAKKPDTDVVARQKAKQNTKRDLERDAKQKPKQVALQKSKAKTGASPRSSTVAKKAPGTIPLPVDSKNRASKVPIKATALSKPHLATEANPQDFHRATLKDNSYHIRGGGAKHNKRTPLLIGVVATVCAIALVAIGFIFFTVYQNLMVEKPKESVIVLTAAQTRQAIDSQMPRLIDHINASASDTNSALLSQGSSVLLAPRAEEDAADADGGEIIKLDATLSTDVLDKYHNGGFHAYNLDELQDYFNGAWFLNVTHASGGALLELKYINFAAEASAGESDPLKAELKHLMALQGLDGADSVVIKEGLDEFNNTFYQGTITIGGSKYYWRVVGCGLSEYYGGQDKRELPATAIFVKCTVSEYDFSEVSER